MKSGLHKFCAVAILCWMSVAGVSIPAHAAELEAKVRGERVNLRAKPQENAEVVGQVSDGQQLVVLSVTNEWVEIKPPEQIDFWIANEFVTDDTVVVNKLNARAGAGINYTVVGVFNRGDKVVRRGSFGEWLKVAAPADARLWVNRSLVEIVNPAAPLLPPEAAPAIFTEIPTNAVVDETVATAPAVEENEPIVLQVRDEAPAVQPPPDLRLIPLDGQGRVVQREGILKKAPAIFSKPPGTHRLVKREGNSVVTTAYLRGDVKRMNSLLEQQLVVRGQEFWVEEVKAPVIVVESMEKRSFY